MSSIGKRIKSARQALDINRAELGRRVGVSGQTVLNWEEDRVRPGSENLEPLAKALNVKPAALLFGEEAPAAPAPPPVTTSQDESAIQRINLMLRQFQPEHLVHVERVVLDLLSLSQRKH